MADGLNRDGYMLVPQDDLDRQLTKSSTVNSVGWCRRWKNGEFTIVPYDNPFVDMWDIILIVSLILTAVVLPFEVALCPTPSDGLNTMNRCVNAVFFLDIILNFNLAYDNPSVTADTDSYVREPLKIASNYMAFPLSDKLRAGWFWPDVITVIPWDATPFLPSTGQYTRMVRVLKLARMFRLVRVLRLFARWQIHFGFSYASVQIVKCLVVTCMTVHWLACFWSFFGVAAEGNSFTWLRQIAENTGSHLVEETDLDHRNNPMVIYNVALYWATMTLTTVGYGDVLPENPLEVAMVTMSMIISGFIWSYVLGSVVNVLSNCDGFHSTFTQTMDDLNSLMEARNIKAFLRIRLRSHLHSAYAAHRQQFQRATISWLSPGLQGELALQSGVEEACQKVWYLSAVHHEVLILLAEYFITEVFSPLEWLYERSKILVVSTGTVLYKGHFKSQNSVFGYDMILVTEKLRETACPRTINFVQLMTLSRSDLWEAAFKFPDFMKRLRRAQIRLAVWRAFVQEAARERRMSVRGRPGRASVPSRTSIQPSHAAKDSKADKIEEIINQIGHMSARAGAHHAATCEQLQKLDARLTVLEKAPRVNKESETHQNVICATAHNVMSATTSATQKMVSATSNATQNVVSATTHATHNMVSATTHANHTVMAKAPKAVRQFTMFGFQRK